MTLWGEWLPYWTAQHYTTGLRHKALSQLHSLHALTLEGLLPTSVRCLLFCHEPMVALKAPDLTRSQGLPQGYHVERVGELVQLSLKV